MYKIYKFQNYYMIAVRLEWNRIEAFTTLKDTSYYKVANFIRCDIYLSEQ